MSESPDGDVPMGELDVPTLRTIGRRAETHPLVESWQFDPSSAAPRMVQLRIDAESYPIAVDAARLDVRWFTTDDYSFHYVESRGDDQYHCRWDRHPESDAPRTHFHPPPDAGAAEESPLNAHFLNVLFTVLDWTSERVERLHEATDSK
jgi:hypothetical protein